MNEKENEKKEDAKTESAKIAAAEDLMVCLYGLTRRALENASGQTERVKGEIYFREIPRIKNTIKRAKFQDPAGGLPRVLFPGKPVLVKMMTEHRLRANRVSDEKFVRIICSQEFDGVKIIWSIMVDKAGHFAEICKDGEVLLSIYGHTNINMLEKCIISCLMTILGILRHRSPSWRKSGQIFG